MSKLCEQPARPRRARRAPCYPRCLGVGVIALVAACGGSVEDGTGGDTSGSGGSQSTASPTTSTQAGGNGGAGGQGAAAGQGGEGGVVHWGGGLDGMSGDPWGGGGVGGYGDSGS